MDPFARAVRTASVLAGLIYVCACVSQVSSTEQIPVPTETEGASVVRAAVTIEAPTATAVRATATVKEAPTPTVGALPTSAGSEEEVPTAVPTIVKEEIEMTPTASVSQGLQRFVDLAVADLTQRLGVDADQIEVIEVKEVVWPDGSLGCPQPGMRYIQVLQDGLKIRLSDGKRWYDYHSGGSREPFLCEQTLKIPRTTP